VPEFIQEVREEAGTAGRRYHSVIRRAKALAERDQVKLKTHVMAGHPVHDIVDLAKDRGAEFPVIGATGHSALYERLIGSRADRIVQLAHCPVLIVK
jgi:nucleotide-binding universal stress UspA family protein